MRVLVTCVWLHAVAGVPQTVTTTTGTINGTVWTGHARPCQAVSVVIGSNSLMGERSATTDREGRYTVSGSLPGPTPSRSRCRVRHGAA